MPIERVAVEGLRAAAEPLLRPGDLLIVTETISLLPRHLRKECRRHAPGEPVVFICLSREGEDERRARILPLHESHRLLDLTPEAMCEIAKDLIGKLQKAVPC